MYVYMYVCMLDSRQLHTQDIYKICIYLVYVIDDCPTYIHSVYIPFIGHLMEFGQHSDITKMSVLFDR